MRAGGEYVIDPALLVRRMRTSTLGIWAAMQEIDPIDENRADWRAGEIAAAVTASMGATKGSGEQFAAEDFMRYRKLQADPVQLEEERARAVAARLRAALTNASGHKAKAD